MQAIRAELPLSPALPAALNRKPGQTVAGVRHEERETFFVCGGNWQADPVSPVGLQLSGLYGRSSNQELINGSPAVGLAVDDQVFLRPTQSESVLLQFGDLLAVRGGRIVERWPVYQE